MENWNVEEKRLILFAKNLTSVIGDSLLCIMHAGIEVYDPFSIDENCERRESKGTKTLFRRDRSELEVLMYESRRKRFEKGFKSPSEVLLKGVYKQEGGLSGSKRRKTSHRAFTNKQLIKVYGMRYTRSVRNLQTSFNKSPKRHRLSSFTPTKILK